MKRRAMTSKPFRCIHAIYSRSRAFTGIIAALTFTAMPACAGDKDISASAKKPNIILILTDDAGYADFGFQGSDVMKTPHIDKLASSSMKFDQAYVTAAVCGPSRAGLLTGRYQQRFGFEENNVPGYMSLSSKLTGSEMGLPLNQKTLADWLKGMGYKTGLVGKWHLGSADKYHPHKRGFDEFIGFRGGARSYYAHDESHFENRPEDRWERGFGQFKEPTKYLTDVMGEEASDFIKRNKSEPFFLMLSFTAVHTPMEATPEDLEQFPELTGKRQTVAAMNLAMDRAVGDVLSSLDQAGLTENTLVVFTNDNGGPSDTNVSDNSPLSGTKANHLEGGIRVPMLMRWPNVIKAGESYKLPVSTLDLLPTFFEAAGGNIAELPEVDGVSLLPFISEQNTGRPHQTLYWKKEGRGAIRDGDWKLVRFPDRPPYLFKLTDDEAELSDLSGKYPEKVRDLNKKLFEWELGLERPLWMLKREYEGLAMDRMDSFHEIHE